jgi:hypothetical protein
VRRLQVQSMGRRHNIDSSSRASKPIAQSRWRSS